MENFTLSCTNENCPWEEDNDYENRQQAEQDADIRACPQCGAPLEVLLV